MDKSKSKDGMLAAGKKRLEQFRQQKQGKGSSSKHGVERSESEHDSHKGGRLKSSAVGNDTEAIKSKSTRMHVSNDNRGFSKSKSGDSRKTFQHDSTVQQSGNKSSPSRTYSNPATNLDVANSFHTEGSILEKSSVGEGEMPLSENGEFRITLDSSQLQPSSISSFSTRSQDSLEENCSNFAGRPDLNINMADLVSLGVSRIQDGENGNSEQNTSPNSLVAFQAFNQEERAALESLVVRTPPCSKHNNPDVEFMDVKSEQGESMQRDDSSEASTPPSSHPSPQVLPILQSGKGQDVGETSWQFGQEFNPQTVRVVPSSHGLVIEAEAASNVEQAHDTKSNEEPYVVNHSKAKPIGSLDAELVCAVCPDADSFSVSQTPIMENVTDSHWESGSYDKPQPGELDMSRVNAHSESSSDPRVFVAVNGHGIEGSNDASVASFYESTGEVHDDKILHGLGDFMSVTTDGGHVTLETSSVNPLVEILAEAQGDGHGVDGADDSLLTSLPVFTSKLHSEDISHNSGNSISLATDGGYTALETSSMKTLLEAFADSQGNGHGIESSEENSSVTSVHKNATELHDSGAFASRTTDGELTGLETFSVNPTLEMLPESQGIVAASVNNYGLEHAELDFGLTKMPPASSIDHEPITPADDHGFQKFGHSSCQNGIPDIQKECVVDRAETEGNLLDCSLVIEDIQKTINDVSEHIQHDQVSPPLFVPDAVVHSLENMNYSSADACGGEQFSEHKGIKADAVLDQFSETSLSCTNHRESNIGFGDGSLLDSPSSIVADQNTGEDDVNTESNDASVENADHTTPDSPLEDFVSLGAFRRAAQDSGTEGSLICSDSGCGIDKGDMKHPADESLERFGIVLVAAEDVQRFDENGTALPLASGTANDVLVKEERTGPLENGNPLLELNRDLIEVKEVEGEGHSHCTESNTGICYAKQAGASSSHAEQDMASAEPGKADVVAVASQAKFESNSLFAPCANKEDQTQTTDLCNYQTDLESNYASLPKLSTGSDFFSDSNKSYQADYRLASSHACMDEKSRLFTHANNAVGPSVMKSLSEDMNADIGMYHSRTSRNADLPNALEVQRISTSNLPAGTMQAGQQIKVKEGIESEVMIGQLQDALCMKETELENMLSSMNAEVAKSSEERELFVRFRMHVVQRLSLLAHQGLVVNEKAKTHCNLFNADTGGSFDFNQFVEDYDCWMDKIQKDVEKKTELDVANRNLEKIQSAKDIEMNELLKKCEKISQNNDALQRDLDEKEQRLDSSTKVLQELLAVKDTEIERLSDVVSKLSHKFDVAMNEMGNAVEERVKMESAVGQLESLLIDKETDNTKLYNDVLELTKKFDLAVFELATADEEKSKVDGQVEQLEDLLSTKETQLKGISDEMSKLLQKCELTSADMGKILEENGNVKAELKQSQNLHLEQANNLKHLEVLLVVKGTELESLQNLKVEQDSKIHLLEEILLVRNTELEGAQKLLGDERERHLTMLTRAGALAQKIANCLNSPTADIDGDAICALEILMTSLNDQYETVSRKNKDLTEKAMECNAAYDRELHTLRTFLSAREEELGHVQEKVDLLAKDTEGHLTILTQANALAEKLSRLLNFPIEAIDGDATRRLEILVTSLHDQYEAILTTNEDLAGRITDIDTAYETDLNFLRAQLIEKEVELGHLQETIDLLTKEREGHLNMLTQVTALAEKVKTLLNSPAEGYYGDAIGTLEILVTSLQDRYKSILSKHDELAARANDFDIPYERELNALRACLSEKEIELGHVQGKLDLLTKELSQTKEDGERKLLESEQKGLGYRERLSLAVAKGKGLVQQRDNLKQQLAEKISELEALNLSYEQQLHAKTVAFNEAESKARLNSEAGERVEALESELSYIRNSSNALRESFLQKDAVLQKIEELLEDASFLDDLQVKDTYEKVEWLLEASKRKMSASAEGPPDVVASRGLNSFTVAEQASQTQEIEQLNKKCDEYVRKYRSMAEELAMLEQSLLERNMLIQRWEEMLDIVDMPATMRGKEPEDKVRWLGTAIADAHNFIAQLQADMERLQITADNSHHSLQELQEQNSVLLADLVAKEDELRTIALDLANRTARSIIPKPTSESSDEICRPGLGKEGSKLNENHEEECRQLFQIGNLDVFIPEIRALLSEVLQPGEVEKIFSASTAFETSLKLLVDKSKLWLAEAGESRGKLTELSVALRNTEEDRERQVESLHEALASKTREVNSLDSQLEGFAAKILSLENHIDHLQGKVKVKTEELSFLRDELNKGELEASQEKEKHAFTREKLSMAIRKGKSVLQQRDTYKQALDERAVELDQLKRDFDSEGVAFTKAKQSFQHQLLGLEDELSSSRVYATTLEKSVQENMKTIQKSGEALDKFDTSGAIRLGDLMEKIQWVSQYVWDLQRKAGTNEQEAKKSKKATELLSLELEEMQGKMDSFADELMNAEKNILFLAEEKKLAEGLKAEAGLRLEHAMANINSLLFEQSESKEAQALLEQENNSLKDSIAAQTEEIRFIHKRTEEQVRDLYGKVYSLRAKQSVFLDRVANEFFKSSKSVGGTRSLIFRIAGEMEKHGSLILLSTHVFDENYLSKWEPENFNRSKEWTRGFTTESIRPLCEEMEVEIQHFYLFLDNAVVTLDQEVAANRQLLSELHNGLDTFMKELDTLKKDADTPSTRELLVQQEERIRAQEELFKAVAEELISCVKEVEGLTDQSADFIPLSFSSHESWQNLALSLAGRLSSLVKNLIKSCQHSYTESEKQTEELRSQLKEAKGAIDEMGQQQQMDKLEIHKCLEQLEAKDGMLKRTTEQLSSVHDILTKKNYEEDGLAAALEKAELKIGQLSAEVEELQKAKQELEASLVKASSKFHATVNNFNKFQSVSEKLIEEAESLHLLLEDRDGQISVLKDEVSHKAGKMIDLQSLVNERTADLSQVYQHLESIVSKEVCNGERLPDLSKRREILEALSLSIQAGSESFRVQLARKDALLQDIQLRHDDLARKVHALESSVQDSHRVMEERGATEHVITVEAEEKGTRGKHMAPSAALVTHGRAGRKAAADYSAVDIDADTAKLLADEDDEDKGHVFKPLTSSRFVPRGTRILVDRLDGFWVSGERLLRRKPGARLSVILYWLVLHIWFVAIML